ncbi:MAG TPA: Rieske (2Fe-2S) protein [Bacteroidota bacterium]
MNSSGGRRKFLRKTGLTVGAFALGSVGLACASSGAPHMEAEVSGSIMRFDTAIPELVNAGDGVVLESMLLEYPILLIKGTAGNFTALSTECSHLGCTVRKEPSLIRCPCHDSAYDFGGRVLNGPAEVALRKYEVVLTGSVVQIRL